MSTSEEERERLQHIAQLRADLPHYSGQINTSEEKLNKYAEDYDEMSRKAANIIADLIKKNPNAILGLATGSTPVGTYNELIQKNKNKEISFQNVTTFNLDEYIDLDKNHPQSYYTFMYEHLFKNIDINLAKTHIPKGQGDPKLNVQT